MKINLISFFLLVVTIAISGCTNPYIKPYPAHALDLPLRETAIFVSADQKTWVTAGICSVLAVDDKKVDCDFDRGCPPWVRVSTGDHEFHLEFKTVNNSRTLLGYDGATLHVKAKEMKARHVYMARYTRVGNKIFARVEDLGEDSNFKLKVPYFLSEEYFEKHPDVTAWPAEF